MRTAILLSLPLFVLLAPLGAAGQESARPPIIANDPGSLRAVRQYVAEVAVDLPADAGPASRHVEFLATPGLFTHAAADLSDVRIFNGAGEEVPYAVHLRAPSTARERISANKFNEARRPGEGVEVSIDMGEQPGTHNEVVVTMSGNDYRRPATLEGSADSKEWVELATETLVAYASYRQSRIDYPPSRFRYLRVRVSPDPQTDQGPFQISDVTAYRTVQKPGEMITTAANLSPREPWRQDGVTGSSWTIRTGGRRVPVWNLLVDVAEAEFARDYVLADLPPLPGERGPTSWASSGNHAPDDLGILHRFHITRGTWRRQVGGLQRPLTIELGAARAGEMRLFVADRANPPLTITRVRYEAPACAIIMPREAVGAGPLQVYFGATRFEPPGYDFARTLRSEIAPAPLRVTLGEPRENPDYVPPPLPFTERFQWLIHTALAAACLALAALIVLLARLMIAEHDAEEAANEPAQAS